MEIIDFRWLNTNDIGDELYNDGYAWSRYYEYPLVLEYMSKIPKNSKIHNSSWGFEGLHVIFKQQLDLKYENCIHTDIKPSELPKTEHYNILEAPKKEWVENFDCVINISTMEEVGGNHNEIFDNLYRQVKKGGYLICTFDYPGLQLENIEEKLNCKITDSPYLERISGTNSKVVSGWSTSHCGGLTCGIFVIRKK